MNGSPDPASPGRARRLVLTMAPPLLILLVPLVLTTVFAERLPDRAYVEGVTAQYAHPWDGWVRLHIQGVVLAEVWYVVLFVHYWRWPELQRWVVTAAFGVSVWPAAADAVNIVALLDATGPAPLPAWELPVELGAAALAGLAGWRLAGPLPSPPEAAAAPPPGVPLMDLAPGQRAVYTASTWSRRKLRNGAIWLAAAALTVFTFSTGWQGTAMLALTGAFEILQARTRLQIDDRGVELTLPWLGRLRRAIPFPAVRFAEVRPSASGQWLGLVGGERGWGYVGGPGPVLALLLADGREFLYSTKDAGTAAALVNASLNRARQGAAGC
ncbi:hypothetical protein [Sphaerisporangium dianthi]|uniref:DUF1648 domain-containing protein n=1 Tax=Sphaerisporangium dianthi TaxID=1436120 RepID=A0ABV9CPU5_9ACTN